MGVDLMGSLTRGALTGAGLDCRRIVRLALCVWLLGCGAACGPGEGDGEPDAEPDVPAQPFTVTIGLLDEATQAFVPLASSDTVEIVVGFQGLIFFDLALLTPAEIPDELAAEGFVHFDDPAQDFSFRTNRVPFEPFTGGRLCRAFRFPFGQDIGLIDGQHIRIEIVLTARGWRSEAAADFDIADEDVCDVAGTGEGVCDAQ